jgi:hypothetical protein
LLTGARFVVVRCDARRADVFALGLAMKSSRVAPC